MTETAQRISAGLERAFAERGFAEPSVGDLRDASGVSLRTLYKYASSREEMVRMALEHRHDRYLERVFGTPLPDDPDQALSAVIDRITQWMIEESSHGCLFHAAVAASPGDQTLRQLLEGHKGEVAERVARAAALEGHEAELTLIVEGLTQAWPLLGGRAAVAARTLGDDLIARARAG